MRTPRLALALALLGTGAFAATATAAPAKPTVVKDIAGDANLLHAQVINFAPADGGVATPGSQAGFDIVSTELKNTFDATGRCTGFTMVMTLSGPPAADARFRLSGDTAVNTDFFIVEHDTGTGETGIRYGGPGQDETLALKPAVVKGSTITWTVTDKQLKSIGEAPGNVVSLLQATTTVSVEGLLFFPIVDKAPGGESTFTFCA